MDKMEMVVTKNSSDPKKIGGYFPQTVILSKEDTDDLEFFSEQKGKRVNKDILINNIKLSSGAKLTDAISCSLGPGNDMMISEKLYRIIKNSKVGPVQFFKMSFHYKKEIITNYYWLHFLYELEPLINFKKTTYNYNRFPELKKGIISDYDSYKKFYDEKDKYGLLRSTKIVLTEKFSKDLDIFALSQINQNIYISKKLYNEMLNANITGLEYESAALEISD